MILADEQAKSRTMRWPGDFDGAHHVSEGTINALAEAAGRDLAMKAAR